MTRNEFQQIVHEICGLEFFPSDSYSYSGKDGLRKTISVKWEIGGYSGGSCWDDSNPQPYTTDNLEPKFDEFNAILREVCPNISHLNYLELESLIKYSNYTYAEYYGNCTKYKVKSIDVDYLWCKLFDLGCLE